ncbi:MAG: hypothetical protein COV52_05540 [Gammaproteobacteria bacterium CG11_big_fil_rev_8_21_14_0_20_46_22]|nr:MAG: hypothetical protein COW05_08120 [Gammaproteobacteria bacterium CG12_big_fil_rev_8_21_14_0_65_46_12]PIR10968.1 MAG: hypothetical protein COV52_05540 [Gammaproteobacteria bacterium CG11_big_fil_rev_8_21_14_0_20_46_22]
MDDTLQGLLSKNDLEGALNHLNKALKSHPHNAQILNQKSLIETRLGLDEAAQKSLEQAIKADPNYAASYNHLGLCFFRQGQFTQAENQFEQALKKQSDYTDALYNLSLCYRKQQKLDACAGALTAILEVNPEHLPAHFLFAKLLLEKKAWALATQRLAMISDITRHDESVLSDIIALLLSYDRFLEAERFCEIALERMPENTHLHYNLGVIASKKGQPSKAIQHYLAAIHHKPDYFEALNNLGVLYIETQQVETAKFYLDKALSLRPDNKALQHTLAALGGDNTASEASAEYISQLFDHYAEHFEEHLVHSLDYSAPKVLSELLYSHIESRPSDWLIADLGCGTGLMGETLNGCARYLHGVDLSEKMLQQAEKKGCYDELSHSHYVDFLHKYPEHFDLIVAADVFVYQGDLTPAFRASIKTLKPGGYFLFSLEECQGESFYLSKSGRFHHSKTYIEQLTNQFGFELVANKLAQTRKQHEQTVVGHLFLLQKPIA